MSGLLSYHELDGLTFVGETISAQFRDDEMALYIHANAPRSSEAGHPAMVPMSDVRKLQELIVEAERRGET